MLGWPTEHAEMQRLTLATLLSASIFTLACDDGGSETPAIQQRDMYFEGAELNAAIQQDPNVTFLVDLRGGAVAVFDESDEAIDLSRFEVLSPSAPQPVPMQVFLQKFKNRSDSQDVWSLRSVAPESTSFRNAPMPLCDAGCDCSACIEAQSPLACDVHCDSPP